MKQQPIRHVWLTPADFLDDADYRSWDCQLCGAYWNLILTLYANKGKMSDNVAQLRQNAQWRGGGFESAWSILRQKFQLKDGYVRHKRVTAELRRARKSQQDKRNAGLRSAEARQQNPNADATLLREGKVRKGKVKDKGPRVIWDGTTFAIPEAVMGEFCERWPNVTREAIDQEILDCAAHHSEKGTNIKGPRGRIITWLKNAFDKYQQKEAVHPQRRKGQDLKTVLGLSDGADDGTSTPT